jgi:hypothetical protein
VFQCLSNNNIIIAAPKTGVIRANILITKNKVMVRNGINTLLFRNPGADNVRLVINKLVNDIVVLIPDNITVIIAISWAPKPVNRVFDENGVINVQPDMVKEELLDLGIDFFFSRFVFNCVVIYHNESDALIKF